jgi:hypothetical protein
VSCGVGFQQNLGQKSLMDPSCQHNFLCHQQPQGHNKHESTTFILPHGSNKQHCMNKEEFHWVFGVVRGWFSAKLGSKISDGSQQSLKKDKPAFKTGFYFDHAGRSLSCLVFSKFGIWNFCLVLSFQKSEITCLVLSCLFKKVKSLVLSCLIFRVRKLHLSF